MILEMFSRPGCHLCDVAKTTIRDALRRRTFVFIERNVEDDAIWELEYGHDIPVIFINGRKAFKHQISREDLERYLERAST